MRTNPDRTRHVAAHLGIRLTDYDRRIRTFIPCYAEMLDTAAAAVDPHARRVLELGVGTGALAQRCLKRASRAAAFGIDADADILALAARRLRGRAELTCGSFLRTPLPAADAIVASFALHHVRTHDTKLRLFRRVRRALRPRGVFITADCHLASDRSTAAAQMQDWRAHVRASYSAARTAALFESWAHEDVYTRLNDELTVMERAGFHTDVLWRRGAFVVIAAR
jgi:spermidine synthase